MILTLYHGSPFIFQHFNHSKSGIHFGSYDQAVHAATHKHSKLPIREFESFQEHNGWRGQIYVCAIEVKSLKRIDDPRTPQAWRHHITRAQKEGFDAIVYQNRYEGRMLTDSYCVFDASSIVGVTRILDLSGHRHDQSINTRL